MGDGWHGEPLSALGPRPSAAGEQPRAEGRGHLPAKMIHYLPGPTQARTMSTEELRAAFLVQGLFVPGEVVLRHVDLDRVVLGGAVPTSEDLTLEAPASLGSAYSLERRELGVLNVGGAGRVTVDGEAYDLAARDVLYVGRGHREVRFESDDAARPARFYLVSYPAHADYPPS